MALVPALNAAEAAEVVGLSTSTMAKLRLSGNGPAYCKVGRRVLYRPDDLAVWLDSRKRQSTSEYPARVVHDVAA